MAKGIKHRTRMYWTAQRSAVLIRSMPAHIDERGASFRIALLLANFCHMNGGPSDTKFGSFLFRCELAGGVSEDGKTLIFPGIKNSAEWTDFVYSRIAVDAAPTLRVV